MAGDASGEWKLEKKFLQPGFILTDVRINLAVCSFKIGVAHNRRATMAGPGDVNHVEVVFFDDAVQVRYVAEYQGQWVGLGAWSAGAYRLKHREEWIGWNPSQKKRRLSLVAKIGRA